MKTGDHFILNFELTLEIYNSFKQTFKDFNPLHTNEKYARERGFKDKIMYGNILNGFISYFIGEHLPMKNVLIYSQYIKFRKPVYLNDSLIFEATIDHYSKSVNAYEFRFNFRRKSKKVANGKIQIGILTA